MSSPYSTAAVIEAYARHPLSRAAIIERLNRYGPMPSPLRELDIAVDPSEEVTDQNHIGGALSTLRLAALAGINKECRVLDLGCGIGGPARLLAEVFGCRVHGIDANPARIDDALALSDLAGLAERTSFECGDFLSRTFSRDYTVVWAQNSWIHIGEPLRLAGIASSALREPGRLAFEDVVFRRPVATSEEQQLVDEVSAAWRSSFTGTAGWISGFAEAGFRVEASEDDDGTMASHLTRLCALTDAYPDRYPPHEVIGWKSALQLARAGVLGYTRIVGAIG